MAHQGSMEMEGVVRESLPNSFRVIVSIEVSLRVVRMNQDVALVAAPDDISRQTPRSRRPHTIPRHQHRRLSLPADSPPQGLLSMLKEIPILTVLHDSRIRPEKLRVASKRRGLKMRPYQVRRENPIHARTVHRPRFGQPLEPTGAMEANRFTEANHHVSVRVMRVVNPRAHVPSAVIRTLVKRHVLNRREQQLRFHKQRPAVADDCEGAFNARWIFQPRRHEPSTEVGGFWASGHGDVCHTDFHRIFNFVPQ